MINIEFMWINDDRILLFSFLLTLSMFIIMISIFVRLFVFIMKISLCFPFSSRKLPKFNYTTLQYGIVGFVSKILWPVCFQVFLCQMNLYYYYYYYSNKLLDCFLFKLSRKYTNWVNKFLVFINKFNLNGKKEEKFSVFFDIWNS